MSEQILKLSLKTQKRNKIKEIVKRQDKFKNLIQEVREYKVIKDELEL